MKALNYDEHVEIASLHVEMKSPSVVRFQQLNTSASGVNFWTGLDEPDRRVSNIYFYKSSSVYGVKVNGKEVIQARLRVVAMLR